MRETVVRSLSGAVYILILSVAVFYSRSTFLTLFGFFLAVSVLEFCALVRLKKVVPVCLALIAYILFAFYPGSTQTDRVLLCATLLAAIFCLAFLFTEKIRTSRVTTRVLLLCGYIIIPFILLAKIPFTGNEYEPKTIFSIFILIWVNDTFAFLVGKSLGKRKLMVRISPKKTVEGFVGGIIFGVLAGILIANFYINQDIFIWITLALITGIFGTLGDLIESKFKRLASVKDSGSIMPGHGGILDRLDSVIFAAPFVFLFYQILNHVS